MSSYAVVLVQNKKKQLRPQSITSDTWNSSGTASTASNFVTTEGNCREILRGLIVKYGGLLRESRCC